jgi:large subunit ribosomal protein L7/L12
MAKAKTEDLLESFKEMTLLELSEVHQAVRGDVESRPLSAAPVMMAGPGGGGGGEVAVEQTEFDVVLTGAGDQKIQSSRRCARSRASVLKEAKDLVDSAPKPVLEKAAKDVADKAKDRWRPRARASRSCSTERFAALTGGGPPKAARLCITGRSRTR